MFLQPIPGTQSIAELLLTRMPDGSFWGDGLMKLAGQFPVEGGVYAGMLAPILWKQFG